MATFIVFMLFIFGCLATYGIKVDKINNETAEKIKKFLMVNTDFEKELIKKIANPQYKEEILNLIRDDLKYVYGDAWEKLFVNQVWGLAKPYTTVFDTIENIILFLMLSKSGLMPDCYRFTGIQISNTKAANIYEALRILQCVEKNIQHKQGSEYKLIFNPKITSSGYGKHRGPETARYDLPFLGSFHWNFEYFYNSSKFVMRDINNPTLVNACKNCSIGERSEKKINNPYKDKLTL